MLILPIIGMVGSGKTTQALMVKAIGYKTISTGDLLRDLGMQDNAIHCQIENGHRFAPEVTCRLIVEELCNNKDSNLVILDGSPLSIEELHCLRVGVKQFSATIVNIIHLSINDNLAEKRSLIRGRTDDRAGVLAARIANYYKYTEPMLKLSSINVINVDASQSSEHVFQSILKHIVELSF